MIVDPGAVIGPRAEIGVGTTIGANAVIGPDVRIGRHGAIGPGATIACALIGDRVIIHPGAHIGQDGFGFALGARGHVKVPQIGRVIIQDDVEIGAGSTIDRGANRDTIIGEGTKIDNLVQIGHNVVIGRHCVIVSQVGISGSCVIDDFAALAGQAGLAGHLHIGAGRADRRAVRRDERRPRGAALVRLSRATRARTFSRRRRDPQAFAQRQGEAGQCARNGLSPSRIAARRSGAKCASAAKPSPRAASTGANGANSDRLTAPIANVRIAMSGRRAVGVARERRLAADVRAFVPRAARPSRRWP